MRIISLLSLDIKLWNAIRKLYLKDSIHNAYLMYDLIYDLKNTNAYFIINDTSIVGYVLIWRSTHSYGIHIWGNAHGLLMHIPITNERTIIQTYSKEIADKVLDYLNTKGVKDIKLLTYIDMVIMPGELKKIEDKGITLLHSYDKQHIKQFIRIKKAQGNLIKKEEAIALLNRYRYYGLFIDKELVSIACAYVKMPEVWIIGDVFTCPNHRGRGYAKAVTSAITSNALNSGAKAFLHVRENNKPAIRVYKALGYREISKRPWIFIH